MLATSLNKMQTEILLHLEISRYENLLSSLMVRGKQALMQFPQDGGHVRNI
jgi:hypothetical protein